MGSTADEILANAENVALRLVDDILGRTASMPSGGLFQMGKLHPFHNSIDRNHRVSNFLRSRMNVIDIIPCQYMIDLDSMKETPDSSGLMPKIDYSKPIGEFIGDCSSYGLDPFVGLRIYTTDDTTASDTITNERKENTLEGMVNNLAAPLQSIRDLVSSVDQGMLKYADQMAALAKEKTGDLAKQGMDFAQGIFGTNNTSLSSTFGDIAGRLAGTLTDVIMQGNRVSFPTIWDNSSYQPNLTANIRLASPYGHPTAIKEFIIKPIMYLLILASPKTSDGVSYGRPSCCSISAYGMCQTPLGAIRSISMRRGGSDSSFNLYRQPMTVDVSIEFDFLVKGFAIFKAEKNTESGLFNDADRSISSGNMFGSNASLTTLKKVVDSLRPFYSNQTPLSHASFQKEINPNSAAAAAIAAVDAAISEAKESAKKIVNDLKTSPQDYISNTIV